MSLGLPATGLPAPRYVRPPPPRGAEAGEAVPAPTDVPGRRSSAWVAVPLVLGAVAPVLAVAGGTSAIAPVLQDMPTAARALGASFIRMLLAYTLSLGFALGYGYACAVSRSAERVMLPILDILQSVPILGFFPIVIVLFVDNLGGPSSLIGPNFAAIFLIFTSMSWNMAFGVYESLKGMPNDLHEAAGSFGVRGRLRLRSVLLPATINRLVYNSILSWTAGWYFLVACEIISANGKSVALVGIGSYLLAAAANGDTSALLAGVIVLVLLIAALDILLWRNLARWAERYRFDTSPSGETDTVNPTAGLALRRVRNVVARGLASGAAVVRAPVRAFGSATVGRLLPRPQPSKKRRLSTFQRSALYYAALGSVLVAAWLLLITLGVAVYGVFSHPVNAATHATLLTLPLALGFSLSRVVAAYLVSLALSLALAIYLFRRPRVSRVGMPIVQIVASVPATALFPLFLFGLQGKIGTEPAVIFVEMTGMIWYLFFNVLSGLRAIPPDLEESARSAGLRGWKYYRRLVLPGIFPAFVTGSITAFGGGWNTLIIAEYLNFGPHTISVLGLGQLIDLSVLSNPTVMTAALLTMVIAVVSINELVWKPLYRQAREKYKYD